MKLQIDKEWFEKRAAAEGDNDPTTGRRKTMTLNLTEEELAQLEELATGKKPRKKASYVGVPAIFELQMACHVLVKAYNTTIYHVGSSLERADWRDVDLVMILDDEEFEREFPNAPLHSASWELDPKWLVLTVSISKWLTEKSGVPVDFKFQPMTFANEHHQGPRNSIGRYIKNDHERTPSPREVLP